MSSPKTLGCLYVTAALRYVNLAYVAVVTEEMAKKKIDHSLFVEWDRGVWRGSNIAPVEWTTVSATVVKVPVEQGLFLGYWGEVLCIGSGDIHEEKIRSGVDESPEKRGPMRCIRSIGSEAYAVGTHRQVYKRDGVNTWTCIDATARPQNPDVTVVSFESIDGFSSEEIYAAGRQGEIWRYNGTEWSKLESPSNMILTNVCCAEDGNTYVCGRHGTLMRGRDDVWEVVEQDVTEEDFWGAVWYGGKLYLSTMRLLYTLENDRLQQVDFGRDIPRTCFQLSTANGVLWSIGATDVMSLSDGEWSRID